MNKNLFKAKVIEKGYSMEDVAKQLGINKATLSRKVNGTNQFTAHEILTVAKILGLTQDDVMAIFFSSGLADTQ